MLKWEKRHKDPQHVQFWGLGLRQGKVTWEDTRDKIFTSVYTIVIQYWVEDVDQKTVIFAADM